MKRILIASALALAAGGQALAADLPPPPPAPATYIPVAPPYNWTGFYIGGNLGAGFSNGSFSDTLGSTFTNSTNTTFLGGGQVGVNYEFWGGLVIGAEAMFDWAPNQNNNITATNGRQHGHRTDQQSLADHGDRQTRLCVGPRACVRQGRWRLGWAKQFELGHQRGTVVVQQQLLHQLGLDRRPRCRVGILGQLVRACRI